MSLPIPPRRQLTAMLAVLVVLALPGCSLVEELTNPQTAPVVTETPAPEPTPYPSQFTDDGTYQSHIKVDGLDFVYTLYPTKATPRTNEWYPRGNKFFSFTFQAYDLDRRLRDPFRTKRKVWLQDIEVTSETKTTNNVVEQPYYLMDEAKEITFDPQPVSNRRGMLVTSPKGAFEIRNQKIGTLDLATEGVDLTFRATVWIERRAGTKRYYRKVIRERVPISIFPSTLVTEVADIPLNAN
ncbi:MAG: hypothetical protein Q8Q02_02250 [Nocardioides sp.]|nr:hypothetical protein [Nocardioides sp.]